MEKYFASFPRYGKLSSTVWITRGNAPARTIRYADLRARNPAPECEMKKEQNKALLGTTHKLPLCTPFRTVHTYGVQPVGRPQNADVLLRNTMINEWRYSDDDR